MLPSRGKYSQADPAKILSLRSRLFERACEQEWTRRLAALEAEERQIAQQRCGIRPRLRVVSGPGTTETETAS